MERVTFGIIGCGTIGNIYSETGNRFDALDIATYADLDVGHAEAKVDEYGVSRVLATEGLLTDPVIGAAIVPAPASTHGDLVSVVLRVNKHAYTGKPFAATEAEGEAVLEATDECRLTVGIASDIALGTGIQTYHDLVNEGHISDPVNATASWSNHSHEHWYPDPDSLYTEGGGPFFDMGPYYLTPLAMLSGPIRSVAGAMNTPFVKRKIVNEPRRGGRVPVSMPTYKTAVVTFGSDATGALLTSFDVWGPELSGLEIYSIEGTLSATDPSRFGGTPHVRLGDDNDEWREISAGRDHPSQQRSLGLVDLAYSLDSGRDHRTSGGLGLHALEAVSGIRRSAEEGTYVELSTQCERPPPVPDGPPTDLGPTGDME